MTWSGEEGNIKWEIRGYGRIIEVKVKDNKGNFLSEKHECGYEPVFGYDGSDVYEVNKITDKLIEKIEKI